MMASDDPLSKERLDELVELVSADGDVVPRSEHAATARALRSFYERNKHHEAEKGFGQSAAEKKADFIARLDALAARDKEKEQTDGR